MGTAAKRLARIENWLSQYLSLPRSESDTADQRRIPRHHLLWLTILALLFAVQISPWWYPTPDGSTYLGIARHLFADEPFAEPGAPGSVAPPGYALLISPAFQLGDRPFLAIGAIHFLLAVILISGVYVWSRRLFPDVALLLTILSLGNMSVWFHYRRTLKEIAFMAPTIWLVNLLNQARLSTQNRWPRVILGAVLLSLIVLVRFSGILFAAGFGLAMLAAAWRKQVAWLPAIAATLLVGVTASAIIVQRLQAETRQVAEHGGPSYQSAFQKSAEQPSTQVLSGSRQWISSLGRVMIPGLYKADVKRWMDFNLLVYALTLGIVVSGWSYLARQTDVFALTLPLYVALHVVWPFDQGGRFAVPMLPVLVAAFWCSVRRWLPHPKLMMTFSLAAHALVGMSYWLAVDAPRAMAANRKWPVLEQAAEAMPAGSVQAFKLGEAESSMLQLALDRPIHQTDAERIWVVDGTDWIVTPASFARVPGFERTRLIDSLAIWKRSEIPADSAEIRTMADGSMPAIH